jgi:EAL domain-containing protein (putative c-di-GMP-specific phosphodiesterase class I)
VILWTLRAAARTGQATRDALRAVGCDLAQRYVLRRPLPAERLTAWLGAAPALAAVAR